MRWRRRRAAGEPLYYGWVITLTLALTETISWGVIYYTFSVYITPMEGELGWSRGEIAGGFSLMLLVAGAMAFPVGGFIDRHGARWLMTAGSAAACALVIAWSQVTTLTEFYLIWAGLGVCAASVLYEPAFSVVAKWFVRRRARALAIITFAAGLASTIFVPLADLLLNLMGWRDAVLALGVLLGVTTVPLHALVLRRRPADLGLLPDGDTTAPDAASLPASYTLGAALHTRFFWLLTFSFFLAFLGAGAIRVHFIPLLIDGGIDASVAALASGAIGIMQVVGRLFFAPLEARYTSRNMVTGVFALQALAMIVLLPGISLWAVGLFLLTFGTSYGAWTLARATVIADLFGSESYGRISSVMSIFLTVAGMIAPVAAGLVYDEFGSYQPVIWASVALALGATAVMGFSREGRIARTPAVTGKA